MDEKIRQYIDDDINGRPRISTVFSQNCKKPLAK